MRLAAEELAPPPPPPKPTVVAAPRKEVVLPSLVLKPEKKSYSFDAIKRRMTDETAATLVELGKQLEEMELGGLS